MLIQQGGIRFSAGMPAGAIYTLTLEALTPEDFRLA
jgi:hypothetical protein